MARPSPSVRVLSKNRVSPSAIARTIETPSRTRPSAETAVRRPRPPASSAHARISAAHSVVRTALMVSVPNGGVSERTSRLVTAHDRAEPSAQSAPTVAGSIRAIVPWASAQSRRHDRRNAGGHGPESQAGAPVDGAEGLEEDGGRAPAPGHPRHRPALRPRLQGAAGEEPLARRGAPRNGRLIYDFRYTVFMVRSPRGPCIVVSMVSVRPSGERVQTDSRDIVRA